MQDKVLVLNLEYDGTEYKGWQVQPNGRTVQETLEAALEAVLGEKISTVQAGRTDTGVHARDQYVSFTPQNPVRMGTEKLPEILNGYLPRDIRVRSAREVDAPFSARFDAVSREYAYRIITRDSVFDNRFATYIRYKLDFGLLQESAALFLGTKNYTTFSKWNPSTSSYVCNVDKSEWTQTGEHVFEYRIRSGHFVYGMVRSVVGTMLDIARGKREAGMIEREFALEDRNLNSPLAPACGLTFHKVTYPEKFGL